MSENFQQEEIEVKTHKESEKGTMSGRNDSKKVKILIKKIVQNQEDKQNQDKRRDKVEVVSPKKDITPHSSTSPDEREQLEADKSQNFNLNGYERELLTVKKVGISRLFAMLTGDSPYETRMDTESIKATTENVRARRELREETVNLVTQPLRAEETLLDARTSLFQKKRSSELENQKHELEKQKIENDNLRLELENRKLRKELEDLKNIKEPAEEKKEVNYDFKDFIEMADKIEKKR
jgi:hypothetical protein